jgi:hypothetical protein
MTPLGTKPSMPDLVIAELRDALVQTSCGASFAVPSPLYDDACMS